ncbi:MAG: DUF2157 domain-containing protein [Sporomusaceae bacterium]|nr:DUF2157 domain-containing protein [Sporomusaceae bacterium]
MDKKLIAALYRDLPDLVAKGVLSPAAAEALQRHYGPAETNPGSRAMLIFGVCGALLVGLGVILLVAHNWAQLTRVSRLGLSLGLLVAAQLAAGLTLYRKDTNKIWREAAAALQTISIGAALALVGQTYHLTSAVDNFVLTWLLLAMPLMYLLRANSAAMLYLLGTTVWSFSVSAAPDRQLAWLLLAMAFPYYWRQLRQQRLSNATAILSWSWNLALLGCFTATLDGFLQPLRPLAYCALFGINYLLGPLWFDSTDESRQPFKRIGLTGSLITVFILTYSEYWQHLTLSPDRLSPSALLISGALLALTVAAATAVAKKSDGRSHLPVAAAPLLTGAAYLAYSLTGSAIAAALIMNGYLLLLAIWVISSGSRSNSIARVNAGMLLLALLIGARFLDADLSFVARGVVFVAIGSGFLVANWLLLRRKAGGRHEN